MTRAQWDGFGALCVLGASGWLVDGAWPSPLPAVEREVLRDVVMAAVLGIAARRGLGQAHAGQGSAERAGRRLRTWGRLALASVLLLGVPAMLVEAALTGISEVTTTALFALAPAMVVVLVANFDFGASEATGTMRLLAPALAGLAGTLLLLPVETPAAWREVGFDVVAMIGVLVAAGASVWMHRMLQEVAVVEAAAVCCAANAMFFGAVLLSSRVGGGGVEEWGAGWSGRAVAVEVARAACFDLPQVVLLVWLLREVSPVRAAARFLVIPLLTVVEGFVLMRPELTLRAAVGAVLMAVGAWQLLTARESEQEPSLMPR